MASYMGWVIGRCFESIVGPVAKYLNLNWMELWFRCWAFMGTWLKSHKETAVRLCGFPQSSFLMNDLDLLTFLPPPRVTFPPCVSWWPLLTRICGSGRPYPGSSWRSWRQRPRPSPPWCYSELTTGLVNINRHGGYRGLPMDCRHRRFVKEVKTCIHKQNKKASYWEHAYWEHAYQPMPAGGKLEGADLSVFL